MDFIRASFSSLFWPWEEAEDDLRERDCCALARVESGNELRSVNISHVLNTPLGRSLILAILELSL